MPGLSGLSNHRLERSLRLPPLPLALVRRSALAVHCVFLHRRSLRARRRAGFGAQYATNYMVKCNEGDDALSRPRLAMLGGRATRP